MNNLTSNLPKITIILVNYCNYTYTVQCVKSLLNVIYENYNIVIVDNASPNESYSKLQQLESNKVHVIQSDGNGGFAKGNNLGINYAIKSGAEYCLLLNNDTIVDPCFLSNMLDAVKDQDKDCAVTCKIMYYPDRDLIWYAGGAIDWKNSRAIHEGIHHKNTMNKEKTRFVDFASGCCLMISKDTLALVGGLSEDYFMYYEDLDYCYQLKKNDIPILYVPNALIYHCVSSSSGGEESIFCIEWQNRSRRIFMKKYGNEIFNPVSLIFVNIKSEMRVLAKIILSTNKRDKVKAYLSSFRKSQKQ